MWVHFRWKWCTERAYFRGKIVIIPIHDIATSCLVKAQLVIRVGHFSAEIFLRIRITRFGSFFRVVLFRLIEEPVRTTIGMIVYSGVPHFPLCLSLTASSCLIVHAFSWDFVKKKVPVNKRTKDMRTWFPPNLPHRRLSAWSIRFVTNEGIHWDDVFRGQIHRTVIAQEDEINVFFEIMLV